MHVGFRRRAKHRVSVNLDSMTVYMIVGLLMVVTINVVFLELCLRRVLAITIMYALMRFILVFGAEACLIHTRVIP